MEEQPHPDRALPGGNADAQRLWAATLDAASEGMVVTDARGAVVLTNRAYTEITGYDADEILGGNPRVLQSGRHDEAFYQAMWQTLARDGRWHGEIWNRRKNGEVYPSWLSISAIRDDADQVTHYLGIFSDVTIVRRAQRELAYLAHHDPLTDLPNRLMLIERLEHAVELARRSGKQFALLFIDLDNFKQINDTWGHHTGDRVLQSVAARLTAVVRTADTVARLGGDEFVVLLENLEREADVNRVTQQILDTLRESPLIDETDICASASIGVALFPRDGDQVDAILSSADNAMYQAKRGGRDRVTMYRPSFGAAMRRRVESEQALREAFEQEQLTLAFQPTCELASRRITGIEALLRWQHPDRGEVMPAGLLPLAEASGDIVDIGNWVLRTACREAASLRARGLLDGFVAVNVSKRQLDCGNFLATVQAALKASDLPADCLLLEINESTLFRIDQRLTETLRCLQALDVQLAIDDFGVGHLPLRHLKRLPISLLKIDASLVQGLTASADDDATVRAILSLAGNLDLSVMAEGIESAQQHDRLISHGCIFGQGFHLHAPLNSQALARLLAAA